MVPAAAEDDITLNPDKVLVAEPGSLQPVASHQVPAELQGLTCTLRVVAENGSSVHPGNTVIVTTGDERVETPGVEDTADGSVIDVHTVVLGDTLEVAMLMGPEGLSSLGFTIGVECEKPPPTAPAVEETTTTTAPTTTTGEPATTTPPPTVLPAQQEAPPAESNVGSPSYTG